MHIPDSKFLLPLKKIVLGDERDVALKELTESGGDIAFGEGREVELKWVPARMSTKIETPQGP